MSDEDNHGPWEPADQITDRVLGSDVGVAAVRRDVEAYRTAFEEEGRATTLPAFQALARIAGWMWAENSEADVKSTWVPVPWWALQAIAIGSMRYMDARSSGEPISFENAFGLAGSKPGKWGALPLWERRIEQFRMALEVANVLQRRGQNRAITIQRAVDTVAIQRGVSSGTVWTAWRKHKAQAGRALQKSSSGSEVHRP